VCAVWATRRCLRPAWTSPCGTCVACCPNAAPTPRCTRCVVAPCSTALSCSLAYTHGSDAGLCAQRGGRRLRPRVLTVQCERQVQQVKLNKRLSIPRMDVCEFRHVLKSKLYGGASEPEKTQAGHGAKNLRQMSAHQYPATTPLSAMSSAPSSKPYTANPQRRLRPPP
jgi:hypothetical protein